MTSLLSTPCQCLHQHSDSPNQLLHWRVWSDIKSVSPSTCDLCGASVCHCVYWDIDLRETEEALSERTRQKHTREVWCVERQEQ